MRSGIPNTFSSPQWIHFFNKKSSIFLPKAHCNTLSSKEMMTIDGYGDREENDQAHEMGKEKREN